MERNTLLDKLGLSSEGNIQVDSVESVSVDPQQVSERARLDLNFLAPLAMPTIFKYLFPPVFLTVWDWLCQHINLVRAFPQLALGLPRGFGKTTLIKIFILYCVLFTNKKFILIISSTATLAENILSDIEDMLNERNIKTVFGDWSIGCETNRTDLKKFGFRGRNIIIAAIGAGGSLRGLNLKNERPDVMIFEDIQTREAADSQTVSDALEQWMYGTAMKAKSPHGCIFLFVGNMYPTKYSILRKLKQNPTWVKFIAGGILSNGESLWEELQPLKQLMQEFENDLTAGHPEIFYSEVLNDENASLNSKVDISKLPAYRFPDDDIYAGNFIIIDPSNDKAKSDEVSIGYCEIHDTVPTLEEVIEDRLSPGDTIRKALTLAMKHNCKVIVVESNAYQYSLLYWFNFICQQLQIEGMSILEIYSGVYSKSSRIIKMFTSLQKGELYYHPRTAAAVNIQISGFNPLKRDNTDGILDLLTYMPKVMELYGEFIVSQGVIEAQEWSSAKVVEFNSPF